MTRLEARTLKILNLGILAHVDAGKTTLTEALLQEAGVVGTAGSVDDGTTRTDSMALERARGITIRAAAVSLTVGDLTINIVDTPGHPDFIAEVERSLSVLDGAILVVSAVEGVQAQTIVLFRVLRRLRVPTIIFVNKIDRSGANPDRVLERVKVRLSRNLVVLNRAELVGTERARVVPHSWVDPVYAEEVTNLLAMHDDELLSMAIERPDAAAGQALQARVRRWCAATQVHPVLLGAATIGVGISQVLDAVREFLPTSDGDEDRPLSGLVFKVDRDLAGSPVASVRIFDGKLVTRDRVLVGGRATKVTGIQVLRDGTAVKSDSVSAGMIAQLRGLDGVRIGDPIGERPPVRPGQVFPLPILESAVVADSPQDRPRLYSAMAQLAEQDPLINLRQDDVRHELFVSLYGGVQKEVLQQTLKGDYDVAATFRETETICHEAPSGTGEAVIRLGDPGNPFFATLGMQVSRGQEGSGTTLVIQAEIGNLPVYLFKTLGAFTDALHQTLVSTLQQGLYGWQVDDCRVVLTDCGYAAPLTGAADYRKLAPLVVMAALAQAGTRTLEPVQSFRLEAPADSRHSLLRTLSAARGTEGDVEMAGDQLVLTGTIPAASVYRLR